MILEKIADRLDAAALGVSVFINQMPEDAEKSILLADPLSGIMVDHELPGYYQGQFDLVVRHSNYQQGEQLCKDAVAAIKMENVTIDAVRFLYLRDNHLPVSFPSSKADFIEFSVNCSFTCSM